jgi:hypothetical protein
MNADKLELAGMAFMQLNKTERRAFWSKYTDATPTAPATPAPSPDRILRRGQVAELLARSPRAVDRLAADGILHKVKLPGRRRHCGFRLSDVLSMIGEQ